VLTDKRNQCREVESAHRQTEPMQERSLDHRQSNVSVFVGLRSLRLEVATVVRLTVEGETHKQPHTGHRLYTNH
jgi:hypothetical protein